MEFGFIVMHWIDIFDWIKAITGFIGALVSFSRALIPLFKKA